MSNALKRHPEIEALIAETGGYCGEHPDHSRLDWRVAVEGGHTLLGYWEWVYVQLGGIWD